MTTAQVVETSVTVNKNSPLQDYVHPDDQTQPTFGSKNYTGVVIFRRSKTTKSRSINFLLCVYRKLFNKRPGRLFNFRGPRGGV